MDGKYFVIIYKYKGNKRLEGVVGKTNGAHKPIYFDNKFGARHYMETHYDLKKLFCEVFEVGKGEWC